jgi:hypothetical protein
MQSLAVAGSISNNGPNSNNSSDPNGDDNAFLPVTGEAAADALPPTLPATPEPPVILPTTPPPILIPDPIVPAKNEIILKLRSTLQHFLDHDMSFQQFLTHREVRLAWWTLARVYRITQPIELLAVAKSKDSSDSNHAAAVMMHWLFLCSCGHGASIGLVNKGPRLCLSCQKKKKQSKQNNDTQV